MIRLVTTHYPELDPARRAEYAECLSRNLGCEAITEVRVLVEGGADTDLPENPKLFTRPISARPTYADFFAWINEIAGSDDISLVANSDIFFDGSLGAVPHLLQPDECYALSRWDVREDGTSQLFDRNDSQDVWIFRGPIRETIVADFPLGVPRCDNRILHDLRGAGYRVANPAFSIRTHHLHRGRSGPVDFDLSPDQVPRPYDYAFPANVRSLPRIVIHNWQHPDQKVCWRFDRRRAARLARQVVRCLSVFGSRQPGAGKRLS